ncbi:hypothetical protein LEN26_011162 [Aphanomyces euteiches]|nr:hypothetical protein LEN26_011162 [Aphanomyces euteiches]
MSLIVSLEDILTANGEEHLHNKIMQLFIHAEEEPPVIFGWINVHVFVQAIQQAQAQAAAQGVPLPPSPFPLPVPMTVDNFKQALLEYTRDENAAPALGTTCLPCTIGQFGDVSDSLAIMDLHQWTQRIIAVGGPDSLPIAHLYVPRERSNTLGRFLQHFPNSLWGQHFPSTTHAFI